MDKYEVTNAKYLRFRAATGHRLPEFWGMAGFRCGPDYPNHPVVGVSWREAVAYAACCGRRLPTESEWEYAARGGLMGMSYPNGETLHPSDGNYNQPGKGGPVAVGSHPANGFDLHDMQGNVVSWARGLARRKGRPARRRSSSAGRLSGSGSNNRELTTERRIK